MTSDSWLKRNAISIIGFGVNLIVLGAFIGRQQQIITHLEERTEQLELRMASHHEATDLHTTAEWRIQMLQQLARIDSKLDTHILQSIKVK